MVRLRNVYANIFAMEKEKKLSTHCFVLQGGQYSFEIFFFLVTIVTIYFWSRVTYDSTNCTVANIVSATSYC